MTHPDEHAAWRDDRDGAGEVADVVDLSAERARRDPTGPDIRADTVTDIPTARPADITPDRPADTNPDTRTGRTADTDPDGGADTSPDSQANATPDTEADTGGAPRSGLGVVRGGVFDAEADIVEPPREGAPVDHPQPPPSIAERVAGWREQQTPILPAWLRKADERAVVARSAVSYAAYLLRLHFLQSPQYAAKVAYYAPVGAGRLVRRQLRWWWHPELSSLLQEAARTGNLDKGPMVERQLAVRRRARMLALLGEAALLTVAVMLVMLLAPWWVKLALAVAAVLVLARLGRPADKPITARVTVGARYVRLRADMVRAALVRIGVPGLKEPEQVHFTRDIKSVGPGDLALVNLPAGTTAQEVITRRANLSSALRLPLDQVWPSVGPEHEGQLELWVGRVPASKMPRAKHPLAHRSARVDLFEGFPFGHDERQRPVLTCMFERNYAIGGQPGAGKTSGGRALAYGVVLDPTAELWIAAFKAAEDFYDLQQFCTRYECGIDQATFLRAADMVEDGLAEVRRRQDLIGRLKRDGKITEGRTSRELADAGIGLHPLVIVFDEVHELFSAVREAAENMAKLIKQGRSVFVTVVLLTQVASKDSVPTEITKCVSSRWCMSVLDQVANDQIMGTGAYKRGLTGTQFRPGIDRGWGVSQGMSTEHTGAVRAYWPTPEEVKQIITRAQALRGTTTITTPTAVSSRNVLADVLAVFGAAEPSLHWQTIAARLRDQFPDAYPAITPEAISARLRSLTVTSEAVKAFAVDLGRPATRQGAKRQTITKALGQQAG